MCGGLLLREVEARLGIIQRFSVCFTDHRDPDLAARLKEACPKGIDVYFENVGGAVFDATLSYRPAFQLALAFDLLNLMLLGLLYLVQKRRNVARLAV